MNEEIKTWTLSFLAKESLNIGEAFVRLANLLQYDVKAKYRLISRNFLGMKFFSPECLLNRPKATRV